MPCRDPTTEIGLEIGLGGSGEVRLLNLSGGGAATVLVDSLLGLSGVLLGKTLDSLRSIGGVLASKALDLGGLLAGKVLALLELGINDLLVLDVDERAEVSDKSSNESKAPHWHELVAISALKETLACWTAYLDEEVGNQGSEERSNGNVDVLGEDNALRLDDKEVDELLNIVKQALKRCLGDSEVLPWPELRSKTLSKSKLASNLCCSGGTKYDPGEFEDVADDIQVTGGEDENDSSSERDTGRPWVLPAQEAVEHAVVVYPVLAVLPKRSTACIATHG